MLRCSCYSFCQTFEQIKDTNHYKEKIVQALGHMEYSKTQQSLFFLQQRIYTSNKQ